MTAMIQVCAMLVSILGLTTDQPLVPILQMPVEAVPWSSETGWYPHIYGAVRDEGWITVTSDDGIRHIRVLYAYRDQTRYLFVTDDQGDGNAFHVRNGGWRVRPMCSTVD